LKQEEREAQKENLSSPNRLYAFFASEGLLSGKFFSARAGAFKMKEPTHAQKETLIRATEFCAKNYGINIDPDTVSVARWIVSTWLSHLMVSSSSTLCI
jgi:hypothetical protein